jgi:FMN-dependent NADH-azoreductase
VKTILYVNPSLNANTSASSAVAEAIVNKILKVADTRVLRRDLVHEPIPHLVPGSASAPLAATLSAEVLAADVIVVAAPMWNFAVPSALKAWVDHIVLAGVTFRYGENGPVGLLEKKRLFIVEASGGDYSGSEMGRKNHAAPYLKDIFGFLGVHDATVIAVSGTAYRREASVAEALRMVESLNVDFPS